LGEEGIGFLLESSVENREEWTHRSLKFGRVWYIYSCSNQVWNKVKKNKQLNALQFLKSLETR